MIMRKLLLFLVSAAAILPAGAQSDTLSADTLHYRMNYHWGFISKTAGEGTVVTRESGDTVSVSFPHAVFRGAAGCIRLKILWWQP